MDKKFSIIVPIYNTEKYLPECVESVICQTYKNLEIILVNDGSLGNADEICKKYLALDTRIKYFSKKNEGVAIARNFGIAKASGDYIFCLDSDDTLDKFFVEELYKSFKKSGSELLVVGSQFNDDIKMIGASRGILIDGVNEIIRNNENGLLSNDSINIFSEKLKILMNSKILRKQYGLQSKKDMDSYAPDIIWNKWKELISITLENYTS